MRYILLSAALLISVYSIGQPSRAELLSQVNTDVWLPFVKGVNENAPDLYNSMLAKDFYWVMSGPKTRIMNLKEYIDDAKKVMDQRQQKGIVTELEVRFLERNVNAEFCSERAIIRFTSRENEKAVDAYGTVQIFSRKENGRWWKSVQYVFTDPATRETFETATQIDKF
jgi:hypothetical protein